MKGICHRNADGSFGTQKDRYNTLQLIATELRVLGWKDPSSSEQPKHKTQGKLVQRRPGKDPTCRELGHERIQITSQYLGG